MTAIELERAECPVSSWTPVAQAALYGALAGVAAQLLREVPYEPASALGGGWAIWVTLGYVTTRHTSRIWRGRDRAAWACVVAAAYLFAWLFAYHALFGLRWGLPLADAWLEARRWVVAVAPACAALGLIATGSLREGLLGDVCLALPLGWSVPEAASGLQNGGGYVAAVTMPTLAVAALVLITARERRWNGRTLVVATLASGAVFYAVHPFVALVIS